MDDIGRGDSCITKQHNYIHTNNNYKHIVNCQLSVGQDLKDSEYIFRNTLTFEKNKNQQIVYFKCTLSFYTLIVLRH